VTFPRLVLLTLLAAAAFLPFLGRRDVVISHEARVVQTARAMAHSGWPWRAKPVTVPAVRMTRGGHTGQMWVLQPDPAAPPLRLNPWLVPVLNDTVRLQKPPLPYWCTALAFRQFGVDWSEALARFVPALLGFASPFLIHGLARRLLGRRFALPAAIAWATSYFIPDEFRKSMADPYLAFFALAALYAWFRAAAPCGNGTRPAVVRRPSSILAFYALTALGLLAKGPPLLLHLLIPIALYHLLARRRPPGAIWLHLLGLAILLAITLPWPLYVIRSIPNVRDIWYFESVGKMTDELEPGRPFYFYFPLLFQLALPWTPVWLAACALPFVRRRPPRASSVILHPSSFPPLWLAAVVLIFSFAHMKKLAYLLPAMPALVLMTAQGLVLLMAAVRLGRRRQGRDGGAGLTLGIQTLIPLGFAVALFFLIPRTALPLAARLAAAGIPAALAAAAFYQLTRRRTADWLPLVSIATVVALVAFFNFVQTPRENARSPRPAAAYMTLALRADPTVTTVPDKLPPEATLYLPIDVAFDRHATTILYLLDDRRDEAAVDLAAFAARLPDVHVTAVRRVPIPGDLAKPRYKLFALTIAPGAPKTLAAAVPATP
jgi:hypothetical protein